MLIFPEGTGTTQTRGPPLSGEVRVGWSEPPRDLRMLTIPLGGHGLGWGDPPYTSAGDYRQSLGYTPGPLELALPSFPGYSMALPNLFQDWLPEINNGRGVNEVQVNSILLWEQAIPGADGPRGAPGRSWITRGGGGPHLLLGQMHADTEPAIAAKGDLIRCVTSGYWSALPVGDPAFVLTVSELGLPVWQNPAHKVLDATAHNDASGDNPVTGAVIYGTADPKWAALAPGDNGKVLTLVEGLPSWETGSSSTAHALLSATHSDSVPAAPVEGDLIFANDTPAWQRLGIGETDQVLTVVGGQPSWEDLPDPPDIEDLPHALLSAAHNDTVAAGPIAGDLIYSNDTPEWQRLGVGSAGQVLTVYGGFPTWQDAPGGGGDNYTFKISGDDSTPGDHETKIVDHAGDTDRVGVQWETVDGGGNETRKAFIDKADVTSAEGIERRIDVWIDVQAETSKFYVDGDFDWRGGLLTGYLSNSVTQENPPTTPAGADSTLTYAASLPGIRTGVDYVTPAQDLVLTAAGGENNLCRLYMESGTGKLYVVVINFTARFQVWLHAQLTKKRESDDLDVPDLVIEEEEEEV